MATTPRWSRALVIVGFIALLVGTVDPLEGSVLILGGTALMAMGAGLARSSHRRLLYIALVLLAVGVGLLFGFSAIGGFGGSTGRSMWWALALLPYPLGWLVALIAAIRVLREKPQPTMRHA